MTEPQIAMIVYKVLKRQVNETRVTDQNRDWQLASVILVAEYLCSVFRLHVWRKFIWRQLRVLADRFQFLT